MPRPPLTVPQAMTSLARRLDEHRSEPDEFGCRLWTGYCNPVSGYGQISITATLQQAMGWPRILIAPWVAAFFAHGLPGIDQQVLHRCNVAECCADDHVHWGTQIRNMQDRVLAGDQNTAKLTPADIYAIRASFGGRMCGKMVMYQRLAEEYSVGERHIRGIIAGDVWGWLE